VLNNYSNPPSRKAAAQGAKVSPVTLSEPITADELLEVIAEYNRTETAAHELKRVIFEALSRRKGYRKIRIGGDTFDGTPGAYSATGSDLPRLIVVESLGE
jgi:hypothetical protein